MKYCLGSVLFFCCFFFTVNHQHGHSNNFCQGAMMRTLCFSLAMSSQPNSLPWVHEAWVHYVNAQLGNSCVVRTIGASLLRWSWVFSHNTIRLLSLILFQWNADYFIERKTQMNFKVFTPKPSHCPAACVVICYSSLIIYSDFECINLSIHLSLNALLLLILQWACID